MPSNTTYKPVNINDFDSSKLVFNATGVSVTATAGETTCINLTMTDDCLLSGVWLIINSGNYGDYINCVVVDTAGIMSPPGTVLLQFVTNWYLPPSTMTQFDLVYPAKILTGLTLRASYVSTGSSNVFIAFNYKLDKVIV